MDRRRPCSHHRSLEAPCLLEHHLACERVGCLGLQQAHLFHPLAQVGRALQ